MRDRPTGFVARCRCGSITGALDAERMERSEMGKMLGEWLMRGCTVEPQFVGTWEVTLGVCTCPKPAELCVEVPT